MSNEPLASKVILTEAAPQTPQVTAVATAVFGVVGVCERGPVATATLCTSPEDYRKTFGGHVADGDVAAAVRGFFANGGTRLWVSRVVHFSDVTDPSTATCATSEVTLQTGATAASSGSHTCSVAGPYALAHGDTLIVKVDGGSNQTTTISATAASITPANAETYNFADGDTLTLHIDGGALQTVTFNTSNFADIDNATAEEVVALLNASLIGASAAVNGAGTKPVITSDRKGTGSSVKIDGGTANAVLGYSTTIVNGTGNVSNVAAVTPAEVVAALNGVLSGATASVVSSRVKITSGTTGGSSSIQVVNTSTADDELGFDNAVHTGASGAAVDTLVVSASSPGGFGDALAIKVRAATDGDAGHFDFVVMRSGVIVETFVNASMDTASDRYIETLVNGVSLYVTVEDLAADAPPANRPANVTSAALTGGDDGLASLADTDFIGGAGVGKTGLRALDAVEDLALFAVPGRASSAVHNAMLVYAETTRAKSCFAVLDPPAGSSASDMVTYVASTAAIEGLTEFGAMYWPRVKVSNPDKTVYGSAATIVVPPSGHIAGVMARTDLSQDGGVFQPPAGEERGVLFDVAGFETDECLDEEKRDLVYPHRINPLTTSTGKPRFIDGTRTLKGGGNFPSVSERRGVIFIEQSVKRGIGYARHSNNDDTLRARVTRDVTAFLTEQMRFGAFRTKDPATAFVVDFGPGLNDAAAVFAGKLKGRIGLATQKPADWVYLEFSQDTRALDSQLPSSSPHHAERPSHMPIPKIKGTPRAFYKAFKFVVEIDGIPSAAFQKCSKLETKFAVIEQNEGGVLIPDKSPGRAKVSDITLSRGATTDESFFAWVKEVGNLSTSAGVVENGYKRTLDIVQQDRSGAPVRRFRVFGAWPNGHALGDWDNDKDENLMEEVVLSIDYYEPVAP